MVHVPGDEVTKHPRGHLIFLNLLTLQGHSDRRRVVRRRRGVCANGKSLAIDLGIKIPLKPASRFRNLSRLVGKGNLPYAHDYISPFRNFRKPY